MIVTKYNNEESTLLWCMSRGLPSPTSPLEKQASLVSQETVWIFLQQAILLVNVPSSQRIQHQHLHRADLKTLCWGQTSPVDSWNTPWCNEQATHWCPLIFPDTCAVLWMWRHQKVWTYSISWACVNLLTLVVILPTNTLREYGFFSVKKQFCICHCHSLIDYHCKYEYLWYISSMPCANRYKSIKRNQFIIIGFTLEFIKDMALPPPKIPHLLL